MTRFDSFVYGDDHIPLILFFHGYGWGTLPYLPGVIMWSTLLLASVFATSMLSGLLGMAGGMILMAILVSLMSVPGAMIVHGVVQATSNGSRAWFLRAHIRWRVLPPYLLGAAATLAAFTALTLHADPAHAMANAVAGALFFTLWLRVLGPGVGVALALLAGVLGNLLLLSGDDGETGFELRRVARR